MSVQLDVSLAARADVDAAAGWYDGQSFGLGDTFRDRVDETFAAIAQTPGRFGPGPSVSMILFERSRMAVVGRERFAPPLAE